MMLRLVLVPMCLLASLPALAAPRGFEVRDLVALERVSSPVLSPDGRVVVFAQREVDQAVTKASTSLWQRNLHTRDMGTPTRLTPEGWNVNSPSFSPDGTTVYFLSGQSGSQQLHAMPLGGGAPVQLTEFPLDVGSYRLSPDGTRVAFSADAFIDCGSDLACTRTRLDQTAASAATGVVYDRLFVRHWDTWADGRRSVLFVATLPATDRAVGEAVAVSAALDGNVPSKPFGGSDYYAWAPDGLSLVASIRVAGSGEAWSTNFDLYRLASDGSGQPLNLTESSPGSDTGPVFSADGNTLYYRAMRRAGFEADRLALMRMDLASGQVEEIAPDWDRSADGIKLAADGRSLYTTAQDVGQRPLFRVEIGNGEVEQVVGEGTVTAFELAGETLVFTRNSLRSNDQLFTMPATPGAPLRAITPSAGERLPGVAFGEFEQFTFAGANGATVHGYVVKPWNHEQGRKYPVAFLIHGGPQSSFGNGWSYRWNPQTYAGQGYAVVMIDFHGSTGYGQAFTDSISQDWGGKPLEDLQKGWQAAQDQFDFLDGDRACALGASYGGYMVNWIAGQWKQPWKCLVNHNGVFDTRSMGSVTEELWFTEWEFGGTVAASPEGYERFNPARHIDQWSVPMLVVAGQNDFRVPVDQSLATFTALQRQGIASRLLYFPDENHWVLKPQNSILWHDTVNGWLRQHIGQ